MTCIVSLRSVTLSVRALRRCQQLAATTTDRWRRRRVVACKYSNNNYNRTYVFYPFAMETTGVWHGMAIGLTQEIGRRITTVTEDTRETTLFQRRNAVSFRNTMITEQGPLSEAPLQPNYIAYVNISAYWLVGTK